MAVFALCEPGCNRAYADGCVQMFAWVGQRLGLQVVPAPSGLSRARSQVTESDLDRIWSMATAWTAAHPASVERLVPGRALIGIDGTTLIMPRSASLSAAYGIRRDRAGREISHYPEALMTSCWDLDTRMPVAWRMQSVLAKGGERAMAAAMLGELPERSIVVMDAGFPSRHMPGNIAAHGHDLVMRMVAADGGSMTRCSASTGSAGPSRPSTTNSRTSPTWRPGTAPPSRASNRRSSATWSGTSWPDTSPATSKPNAAPSIPAGPCAPAPRASCAPLPKSQTGSSNPSANLKPSRTTSEEGLSTASTQPGKASSCAGSERRGRESHSIRMRSHAGIMGNELA